jgi:polyisoprenoid-binding protein YceI
MNRLPAALSVLLATAALGAQAAAVTYAIDPMHTYPSFEADHMGGVSTWRGKFDKTKGSITLDREAGTGTVDIQIDPNSIDYGLAAMNKAAKSNELFDTAKYPRASYKGKLEGFTDGKPTRVVGMLELHGVTKPVTLDIRKFKCMPHPMLKRELCGADAYATINREDFGMAAGKDWGFDMKVDLRIQVEAIAAQ